MDDGLKQRLIGAIVLFALVATFLPVLFDRENMEPVDQESRVPSVPYIEPISVPPPEEPDVEVPAPDPAEMLVPDETQPASLEPEAPSLNPSGTPKSWVLQTGSFSRPALAHKMRDTLIAMEFAAYTRQVKSVNGTVTRVYVGPKLDKRPLLDAKTKIDKKFKIQSLLLEFTPN